MTNQESTFSVPSSKVLFDLLDEHATGAVPLSKIEHKWRAESVPNLPGVLECLRELSPQDHMITFEVFDWSLRVALSRVKRRRNEERIAYIEQKKRELTRNYGGKINGGKIQTQNVYGTQRRKDINYCGNFNLYFCSNFKTFTII